MFKFLKLNTCGNDFLFFFKKINKFNLIKFSNKKSGISCDQIFIIKNINFKLKNIKILIFNNDISIANNCGNGIRCLSWFFLNKFKKNTFIKIFNKNNITFSFKNFKNKIYTIFKKPKNKKKVFIRINNYFIKAFFVEFGNLHLVILINNIKSYYINYFTNSIKIFFNDLFNVEFIKIINNSEFYIRIFERVVGETYSCGSGIISSYYSILNFLKMKKKILIKSLGGNCSLEKKKNFFIIDGKINFCCFGYL